MKFLDKNPHVGLSRTKVEFIFSVKEIQFNKNDLFLKNSSYGIYQEKNKKDIARSKFKFSNFKETSRVVVDKEIVFQATLYRDNFQSNLLKYREKERRLYLRQFVHVNEGETVYQDVGFISVKLNSLIVEDGNAKVYSFSIFNSRIAASVEIKIDFKFITKPKPSPKSGQNSSGDDTNQVTTKETKKSNDVHDSLDSIQQATLPKSEDQYETLPSPDAKNRNSERIQRLENSVSSFIDSFLGVGLKKSRTEKLHAIDETSRENCRVVLSTESLDEESDDRKMMYDSGDEIDLTDVIIQQKIPFQNSSAVTKHSKLAFTVSNSSNTHVASQSSITIVDSYELERQKSKQKEYSSKSEDVNDLSVITKRIDTVSSFASPIHAWSTDDENQAELTTLRTAVKLLTVERDKLNAEKVDSSVHLIKWNEQIIALRNQNEELREQVAQMKSSKYKFESLYHEKESQLRSLKQFVEETVNTTTTALSTDNQAPYVELFERIFEGYRNWYRSNQSNELGNATQTDNDNASYNSSSTIFSHSVAHQFPAPPTWEANTGDGKSITSHYSMNQSDRPGSFRQHSYDGRIASKSKEQERVKGSCDGSQSIYSRSSGDRMDHLHNPVTERPNSARRSVFMPSNNDLQRSHTNNNQQQVRGFSSNRLHSNSFGGLPNTSSTASCSTTASYNLPSPLYTKQPTGFYQPYGKSQPQSTLPPRNNTTQKFFPPNSPPSNAQQQQLHHQLDQQSWSNSQSHSVDISLTRSSESYYHPVYNLKEETKPLQTQSGDYNMSSSLALPSNRNRNNLQSDTVYASNPKQSRGSRNITQYHHNSLTLAVSDVRNSVVISSRSTDAVDV